MVVLSKCTRDWQFLLTDLLLSEMPLLAVSALNPAVHHKHSQSWECCTQYLRWTCVPNLTQSECGLQWLRNRCVWLGKRRSQIRHHVDMDEGKSTTRPLGERSQGDKDDREPGLEPKITEVTLSAARCQDQKSEDDSMC